MKKRVMPWWVPVVMAAAVVIVAAACSGGGSNGDGDEAVCGSDPSDGAPAVSSEIVSAEDVLSKDPSITQEATVDWGWMFELAGVPQIQVFGMVTGDGVKLAVQEINEAGGFQVGDTIYKINLIEHDTRSEVANTLAITTELIKDSEVCVIWGPAAFGEAEATLITQPNQVLHLCPCQDRDTTSLSTVEKAQGESMWAFQTLPAVSRFFLRGAQNTKEEFPEFQTVALLCINTEIGQSVCGFYEDAYTEAGFDIVAREDFPVNTTNYNPFLTRIRATEPDILLNFDDAAAQINLLRQAMEQDVASALNTSLTPDLLVDIFGDSINDKIFLSGGIPRQAAQPTSDKAAAYFERYEEFSGGTLPPASFVSLLTYDFVYMVVAAMQQAETVTDSTRIAEALETVRYNGVAEDDIFFDERHIAVMGSDDCTVIEGEANCVHSAPDVD